jgi:hypothetical protein
VGNRAFEWSIAGLIALVIVWIVLGIVFHILPSVVVILVGIVVEIMLGGLLLLVWSKGN